MASFLHVSPDGMRFNTGALGAWYAALALSTAAAEVAHHLRREAVFRRRREIRRKYRTYAATLDGSYVDIRGPGAGHQDALSPGSYTASQSLGETIRASAHAATWSGKYWKTGTGGTVWNGITFDPELNQIYIGVGNGGPYDEIGKAHV